LTEAGPISGRNAERLAVLDALRGVAAMAVAMGHHAGLWRPLNVGSTFFLAVDFFFALSGFVLAEAYGPKLDQGLGVGAFMRLRLLRLFPLYLIATVLGWIWLALLLSSPGWPAVSGLRVAGTLLCSALMLPSHWRLLPGYYGQALYPLNTVVWTLAYELVGNFLMVLCWRRMTRFRLLGVMAAAAMVLGVVFLGPAWSRQGRGWVWSLGDLLAGSARMLFSFSLGILLQRLPRQPLAAAWAWPLAALGLWLFTRTPDGAWVGTWSLAIVMVGSPLLLYVAAGAAAPSRASGIFVGIGSSSYALYVLYEPASALLAGACQLTFGRPLEAWAPWAGPALLLTMLALAWALTRWVDEPFRRWVRGRWLASVRRV
jgi:peptidoglycan/LPS O-acetylase OafA/YrhL